MVGWLWGKHCLRSPQTGLINVIIIINCSSNSLNVTFASLRKCLYLVEIHSTFTSLDFKEPTSLYKMQQMYNPSLNDNILEMTLNTSPLLLLLSNVIWSYCWQWFTVSTHTCILLTVVHCQYTHTCTKNRLRSVTLRRFHILLGMKYCFTFHLKFLNKRLLISSIIGIDITLRLVALYCGVYIEVPILCPSFLYCAIKTWSFIVL